MPHLLSSLLAIQIQSSIDGITQAGVKGYIYLTPTLDAEFVTLGDIRSLDDIPKTGRGVPTPALMTRAVHTLNPL